MVGTTQNFLIPTAQLVSVLVDLDRMQMSHRREGGAVGDCSIRPMGPTGGRRGEPWRSRAEAAWPCLSRFRANNSISSSPALIRRSLKMVTAPPPAIKTGATLSEIPRCAAPDSTDNGSGGFRLNLGSSYHKGE